MTGIFLFSWAAFPVLMLLISTGTGVLVRRATGGAVPLLLVVPIGFAATVVLTSLLTFYSWSAPLAGPACALVGLTGLLLAVGRGYRARRTTGRPLPRLDGWAALAAFVGFSALAAPIVLTGHPGWTGYAHIVDTSYEFDLAVHFAHSGRHIPTARDSAYQVVMQKYLGTGYPEGAQATLGALSRLTPVDLSWLYQAFLAFVAAVGAISGYSLLGGLVKNRALRALAALTAVQASILYGYALTGGIKELTAASCLLTLGAAYASRQSAPAAGRRDLALPIAVAATFAALSLATLPWILTLSAGVFLTDMLTSRGGRARVSAIASWLQMAAISVVLALPTLAAALKLLPSVRGAGPIDLGNLAGVIPAWATAGVWLSSDYRFPQYAHRAPSHVLDAVVLALAVVGLLYAVRRRAWSLAWLGVAAFVSIEYVSHRYGPWIQFKAHCVSAPIALLLAFAGAQAAGRAIRRPLVASAATIAVALAVLAGNALLYHNITLAPAARMHDLEQIGKRFAGQGPTLAPDFDEYSEYYLRDALATSTVNGPPFALRRGVNRDTEPGGKFFYDLNEFSDSFIQRFRTIVLRRNPLASRPPGNYALVYLSRYYEVWQRHRPSSSMIAHYPLSGVPPKSTRAVCRTVLKKLHQAGPGARIVYSPAPPIVQLDSSSLALRGALKPAGGVVLANGRGVASGTATIPKAGRWSLYLGGSNGRPVRLFIDGRSVGTDAYEESYPGQYFLVTTRWMSRGGHQIRLVRGGVSLHPGNGDGVDNFNRSIGPLVITASSDFPPPVVATTPGRFRHQCARPQRWDWVEVVTES